ncbi:MAG TPA: response regulator [Chloroflexi bacterium]|nr:MAG: hypothetical protein B6243_05085 [Anaerolineaceae bacterium 4572_5.2]HEY85617.1 response regulator [Chloroflexota bacterium]
MNASQKVILLVEDDSENRRLTKDLLSFQNYRVIEAEDSYQALDILQRDPPDLILTDVSLPGMDGLTLTQKIRAQEKFARMPIIVLTAYLRQSDQEALQNTTLLQCLLKPVNIPVLLTHIQNLMQAA